jgi:pimeloyl-ACP methyl ester carboxylesterase
MLTVITLDLPSVRKAAAYIDRNSDITAVVSAIQRRLERGRGIILVGNSYGATVISEAVKDFEKISITAPRRDGRPANTPHGKIRGLIMVNFPSIQLLLPEWC